ncbi:hypothetical protein EX30DRAFT_26286 [Ascodesmis nigricans]|uniref:Disease resistance R13L4/SHOC-2-like LRR domain-containing protein n=1 Tax=Ascodesmis nigricans TaxID=341454 RepID=A0A4S2N860_9PEZI|nr:hypothetical protein EX30DRAFT_26286 [Ascodesmis nigricans]
MWHFPSLAAEEVVLAESWLTCAWFRLALAHNQLTAFPQEFGALKHIRYLNLRSNWLQKFPTVLTSLTSLEILDISRNRIKALPADFGALMNLKVLAMSINKISILPKYIADMKELKIFKFDQNPIVYPPREVWDSPDIHRDILVDVIQRFLREEREKYNASQDMDSDNTSEEGEGDLPLGRSSSNASTRERDLEGTVTLRTVRPLRIHGVPVNPDSSLSSGPRGAPNGSPQLSSSGFPPQSDTSPSALSQAERFRSNSESVTNMKRRGLITPRSASGTKPTRPNHLPVEGHRNGDEGQRGHLRGYSHDSHVHAANQPVARSPRDTESDRRPVQYFKRLSSLPEHKRSSLSTERVGEAARGILYAMSVLHKPIEQYIQSTSGEHSKIERALYNGNFRVGSLVNSLEAYEEKHDETGVQQVIHDCEACVRAFRQVLSMLQASIRESPAVSGPDSRYSRTLLLLLYGSFVEIKQSYDIIQPLLISQSVAADDPKTRATAQNSRANTFSGRDRRLPFHPGSIPETTQAPLLTPRTDVFTVPPTPGLPQHSQLSDAGSDQTDQLQAKVNAAIGAAISNLPVIDREVQAGTAQNLQPSLTLKLREVSSLCAAGTEVARKLSRTRWDAIHDGDATERRRFWEETNRFTQLIIGIAELIKSVTPEYNISKRIIATVVRPTKELYILMSSTSLRHMNDNPPSTTSNFHPPSSAATTHGNFPPLQSLATPLSAALGPAAQATLPLDPASMIPSGFGGYSSASSRTGTLLSSYTSTMTSTAAHVGMSFPNASAPVVGSPQQPQSATFAGGFQQREGLQGKPVLTRSMTTYD